MSPTDIFSNSAIWIIVSIGLTVLGIVASIVIVFFVIRFIRNSYGSGAVKNGVTAPATITRVWDTGTTINDSPLVGMELQVMPTGSAPFIAECKQVVNRLQVGYFQPGQSVTISYDLANPKKIHITEVGASAPVQSQIYPPAAGMAAPQGMGGPGYGVQAGIPGMPAGASPAVLQQQLQQIDAANEALRATGLSAQAQILNVMNWNILVNGENPAVTVTLQVNPPGKPSFMAQASGVIGAVAISKYQPGCTVWVKYDPNNLTRVTLDHS
jgi:hypothetical protein